MLANGVTLTAEEATQMAQAVETWRNVIARTANLDSRINNAESMPDGGTEEMARLKKQITLPNGTKTWITGDDLQAMIENAVKQGMKCAVSLQDRVIPGKQIRLKDFIENEYKPTYFAGLAETTKETQRQYLEYNVYPFLGDMYLADINVITIQNFFNWMAEGKKHGRKKNINQNSINNVSKVLNKIFNVAVAMHYIDENPIKRVLLKNPGEASAHHKALTKEDARRAREEIPKLANERQRLFMALLAFDTGMRPEEILGLRWEDINLEEGYLEIKRTVTYPDKNKPHLKDGGKTARSARPIIINPALAEVLKTATERSGYIVHGKTTEDIPCKATYQRTYERAFTALGLNGYTPYDWRSTFATELCEMGNSSKIVADMMGHSTTRMVDTVYAPMRKEGILANRNIIDQKSEHYFSAS